MADDGGRSSFWADFWSFGREILIVVIGVALGLWAQQLASDAGWRETVANARRDMISELRTSAGPAERMVETADCVTGFAARARRIALSGRGALPKVVGLTLAAREDAAWRAAASTQALGHLTHADLEDFAYAYLNSGEMADLSAPIRHAMAAMRTVEVSRPVRDPGVLQSQLEAIATFELEHSTQVRRAEEFLDHLKTRLQITPDAAARRTTAETKARCEAAAAAVDTVAATPAAR